MIKKVFLTILPIIIIMSIFAFCFSIYWNVFNIPYLHKVTYNNIELWEYDLVEYARNLAEGFSSPTMLNLNLPTRQWIEIGGLDWFADLANDLAVVFNWIYMPLNILLYPVRILTYIIRAMFSVIGIPVRTIKYNDVTYQPMWFIQTLNWITENLSIPYI